MNRLIAILLSTGIFMSTGSAKPIQGFSATTFLYVHPGLSDETIADYAKAFYENGVNGIIIGGGRHHYIYDDLPYLEEQIQVTRKVVEACHQYGIQVAEHHSNVLITDASYAEAHQEWLLLGFDEEQKPGVWPEYGTWSFCPNQSGFRQHYWSIVSDFIRRTGVDALMSDDACFHKGCSCKACQERWEKENSGSLLEAYEKSKVAGSPEWRLWHETRRQWLLDFRQWLYNQMQEEFPDVQNICLSNSSHAAWPTLVHGFYPEAGLETAEAVVWEVYNPADFYSWRKIAVEASIFNEAAARRNVSVICLPFADKADSRDQYDPEEEVFMWGLSKAFGLDFCVGRVFLTGIAPDDPPRKFFRFENERLQNWQDSRMTSPLGIFYSRRSRDTDPRWESGHVIPSIAWGQMCLSHALPFRAVTEETLSGGRLDEVKVLLLPNVFALSDENLEALEAFVQQGGTLVATAWTATHDEDGALVYARRSKTLERLWGVSLQVEQMTGESTTMTVPCQPTTAKPVTLNETLVGFQNTLGKGRVYYLPDNLGADFYQEYQNEGKPYAEVRNSAQAALLADWIKSLIPKPPVAFEVRNPGEAPLIVTHTHQNGQLLIHMLNTLGSSIPPGSLIPTPFQVIWGEPQEIVLEFLFPPNSIRVISYTQDDDIQIEQPSTRISLRTPEVYQLVVVGF